MPETGLLAEILAPGGLSTVFQPIFGRRGALWSVAALECLSRGPEGTNLASAGVLFEYVRRKRAEPEVDRRCVSSAIAAAGALPSREVLLCLNVHASTLGHDHRFAEFLGAEARANGIAPARLIVEITEQEPAWDRSGFDGTLRDLRLLGVSIALDDFGSGQSNLSMLVDARPDWVKLDRHLVEGCHADRVRRSVIASVVRLAEDLGASVVAEGVSTRSDLAAVEALGADFLQGFLLARPMRAGALVRSGLLEREAARSPEERPRAEAVS